RPLYLVSISPECPTTCSACRPQASAQTKIDKIEFVGHNLPFSVLNSNRNSLSGGSLDEPQTLFNHARHSSLLDRVGDNCLGPACAGKPAAREERSSCAASQRRQETFDCARSDEGRCRRFPADIP